ncbi:MAG TPA: S-adenosylmethionine:tRNA ribosyltransferase-isomerase, partial [Thermoanaerobaculia bacterium]
MRVDLFDYALPAESIAQQARPRGSSRLMVLGRGTSAPEHRRFADLPSQLRPGDLLVRNDVGVRPARLYGKDGEDRLVEIFLVRREDDVRWRCLAKPGRRAKAGRAVRFDEGIAATV